MSPRERPTETFDLGLQHERTALAWERTSIAMMTAGVVFARYAAGNAPFVFAVMGLLQTAAGAWLLVWSAAHYEDLHGRVREGESVVHPFITRWVGLGTVALTGMASIVAIVVKLT